MKTKTLTTLTATVLTALLFTFAFAAEAGVVTADLKTTDYNLSAHLKSIPAEYRKQVNATHHLSVIVMDAKGALITDATISYSFKQGDKEIANGKLVYMAAPMPPSGGGGHQHGGMATAPDGMMRMCEGNPNCKNPNCPHKTGAASGHYGADMTLASVGKQTLTLFVNVGGKVQSASVEIVVPQ